MRLVVPPRVREVLHGCVDAASPYRACGLLLGDAGAAEIRVTRVLPCPNAVAVHERRSRFRIDPATLVHVSRSLRGTGTWIVGFFHSRPDGGTGLHASDRMALRLWPETVWMSVTRADGPEPTLRGWWRGSGGRPRVEELEIMTPRVRTRSLCPG